MEHVGVVPLGGVIDGLVIARYAVLKDGGAHEEAVGGVEALRLKLAHGAGSTAVGLAEEEGVARDEEMMMRGEGPDNLVPILMAYAEAVLGDAPERLLGHLGTEEADGVPAVDGAVARPFAAIAASSMDEAVVGVVVYGPDGKAEGAVDKRVGSLQALSLGGGCDKEEAGENNGCQDMGTTSTITGLHNDSV